MLLDYKLGQTSIVLRVKIRNSSVTTGAGLTGLTNSSTGLIISTIADNEATATAYTAAGSTIDTVATLGTFAAPTTGHCRFKEVDPTNHKGIYEIQIDNSRFAVSGAKSLLVSISGAANAVETDVLVPLRTVDPYNANFGLTNLDAAVSSRSTYAGADTAGTTTLLARLTSGRATGLDNLDVAVSTRSVYAGGPVASVTGNVGGNVGGSVASVTAPVTAGTVTDKTGYGLAATGLDLVGTTAPTGPATTFPAMVVQLWRRFYKKTTLTSTQLETFADNGTTVLTTQNVSDDGTTQTQGAAS